MKFIMVVIICFGVDCRAIFEETLYDTYQSCYQESTIVAGYMQQTYPQSAGEVHCWDEAQFEEYNKFLEQGGKPTIDPRLLPKENGISA